MFIEKAQSVISCCQILIFQLSYFSDVSAYPPSVNILEGVENDVRTADKLIDGVNDKSDGSHSWLAPVLPGEVI